MSSPTLELHHRENISAERSKKAGPQNQSRADSAAGKPSSRKQTSGLHVSRSKLHLSNLQSVLVHTSPAVPVCEGQAQETQCSRTFFRLSDLWAEFEEWSAFGVEVPVALPSEAYVEVTQCYVPSLSAIQIFERSNLPKARVHNVCPSFHPLAGYASDGEESEPVSSDVSSSSSVFSTDSDSEDSSKHPPSNGVQCSDRGSVLRRQMSVGDPRKCVFEYYEKASPYAREPLTDKVHSLALDFPGLLNMRSCDVHPASWFAVAWYPLYRIPSGRSIRDLSACFLTFHSLSLPAGLGQPAEARPEPPQPPPASAAAYHRRQEVLLRRHKAGVAFLQPFAFVPYKLSGRTWTDDENSATIHHPMMAAAVAWVQRRRVKHPDLEFFSQQNMSLPSGRQ